MGIRLSIELAEVGLPEYVISTTKCLVQKIHNEWPLSDIVGNITQHSREVTRLVSSSFYLLSFFGQYVIFDCIETFTLKAYHKAY